MHLDLVKTIQATTVLLQAAPGRRMSYMRLLKLLYLADRRMMQETGSPITFDRVVAMRHGPVLSETYSLIRGEHPDAGEWSRYVSRENYQLVPTGEDPGRAALSRMAVSVLNDVSERHEHFDDWQLVDHLHETLPEWKDNWDETDAKKSVPVGYEDILLAMNFDPADAKIVAEEIRATRRGHAG
jgi:uncharacterized phage-associated protein